MILHNLLRLHNIQEAYKCCSVALHITYIVLKS